MLDRLLELGLLLEADKLDELLLDWLDGLLELKLLDEAEMLLLDWLDGLLLEAETLLELELLLEAETLLELVDPDKLLELKLLDDRLSLDKLMLLELEVEPSAIDKMLSRSVLLGPGNCSVPVWKFSESVRLTATVPSACARASCKIACQNLLFGSSTVTVVVEAPTFLW